MEQTISTFLEHLIVEKGFSRNTSAAYRNDLQQFWEFFQEKRIGDRRNSDNQAESPWRYVDLSLLNDYIGDLRIRKGYRDTTTARKVASLKSFFGYLAVNGIIAEVARDNSRAHAVEISFCFHEIMYLVIGDGYGYHEKVPGDAA